MAFILGKAGKALFEKHLEQYAPADPMYEYYTEGGKQLKRKRELPPGLSKRDAKILKSVKKRAHRLDKGFSLCGFRFGWTFVIGIIPVVGDAADASLNYLLVVRKARQAELPGWLLSQMLVNNAISAGIGFVPVVGDVLLAVWKANSRNAALLEEFLRIRGEEFLRLESGQPISSEATASTSKAVNRSDVEQVKPGAGTVPGEVVPGALNYEPRKKKTIDTAVMPEASSSSTAAKPLAAKRGFWGRKSNDKVPTTGRPVPEKGRFVENMQG